MFRVLKGFIVKAFLALILVIPANAEFILFKRSHKGKGGYYPIDAQSYLHESKDEQSEIKKIFNEILMVYQWPMITAHFFELPPDIQNNYLKSLEHDHGISLFIQDMLNKNFGKETYKVQYIPTTIFELAAINSFMSYIINYQGHSLYENQRSIFPENDFRNGDFISQKFKDRFAGDIISGLREHQGQQDADILAMKKACDQYNKSEGTFEMFLETTSYLKNNFENILDENFNNNIKKDEFLKDIINSFINFHDKLEHSFDGSLQKKEQGLWGDHYGGKYTYNEKRIKYISSKDSDSLIKGVQLDLQAEQKNQFLLFRGTGGFKVSKAGHINDSSDPKFKEEDATPNKDLKIIDSPYRESAEEYAEANKNLPKPLKKNYLPLNITNEPDPKKENTFFPVSLSYGNSLMAGTFFEASASGGARALDYLREGLGYALQLPIKSFFKDADKPSLRQKYLVSALHPLVALFAKGEYFHSRSKISLVDPKKKLRGYGGINMPTTLEKEIIELDRKVHAGFIVTPGIAWSMLHPSITQDIALHFLWVKKPSDPSDWEKAQKDFADFSSGTLGFKEHFLQSHDVFEQIKRRRHDSKTPEDYPIGENKAQNYVIPETKPDEREYQTSNVFAKIINNPVNANTVPIIDNPHSMSFNDLRKRTKEHALVIPKGPYISFSHFSDFAKPEEIRDMLKSVAETANKLGIAGMGYRIVTNNSLNPGQKDNNDAEQEIPHFHIHISGGECLGKAVAGSQRIGASREEIDMTISPHPFGSDWTPEQLYQYAIAHKIGERLIKTQDHKIRRYVAYRINEEVDLGVAKLIGFLVLDDKRKSAYTSLHQFAENASTEEMSSLFKFINDTTRYFGIYKTGYRLIADFGNDAGQYPKNVMNIMVAGGNLLGVTVTNMYGNHKIWQGGPGIYDYTYLTEYPHEHCAANATDTYKLLEKIKNAIPKAVNDIKKQQEIDLSYPKKDVDVVKKIREHSNPEIVTKLDLTYTKLKTLPDDIFEKFTALEELILNDNKLTTLPSSINGLKNLKILSISQNKFKTLPISIGELNNLKQVRASDNELESLPETIKHLTKLEQLDISGNKLKTLPSGIEELKGLEELYIDKNALESLPESITNLVNLKNLSASNNGLQDLPATIGNLINLQELDLSENKLASLPDTIGNLSQLKELKLENNNLQTLPDTIGKLTRLKKLYLGKNKLTYLPHSMGNLKTVLTYLNLGGNKELIPAGQDGHMGKEELQELFGKKVKF